MPVYAAPKGTIESLEAERDQYRDLADRLKLEAQVHAMEARTQTATVHECYQAASGATGEKASHHGANPVRERIASLEAERDELRATVERYREALEEIRDHPWNEYRNPHDHPYSTGVTDGHRCCTKIARRALNPGDSHEQD